MNVDFGGRRMRATTVAIDDPGPLHRFLPAGSASTAFLRGGEGIVTIGEVGRFETDYPDAADVWWTEIASQIDHDSELPGAWGTGPLAVGSFAFDPDESKDRSVLVVPERIIGRRNGQCWLTQICEGSCTPELPPLGDPLVPPRDVELLPGHRTEEQWADTVGEVLELIRHGHVEKVVLARDLLIRASSPLDPRYVLARLVRTYPMCWSYLVDGQVGATPEMLIRLQGGLVTSRVLAGTVSIDPDSTDPLARGADLARSRKDIGEHAYAVDSVATALEPYCRAMNVPESPSVLPLPNVLHLATDVTGAVAEEHTALALAAALHPSAAVCGTPTHSARDVISQLEGLDRGRYAGPVGWVDAYGDGEWAIALRGGRIHAERPDQIQLFAGCGIVADSNPAAELDETHAKFAPMLSALGL